MTKRFFKKQFLIICLICIGGVAVFFLTREARYSRLIVSFNEESAPCIEAEVQGQKLSLEISFGSKFPLSLSKQVFDSLEKTEHKTISYTDGEGSQFSVPSYLIPEIKVGNHTFTNVVVIEQEMLGKAGIIGRSLLMQTNVLLDLSRFSVILCNDPKKLEKVGYYLKNMTAIPFKVVDPFGVFLEVDTIFGKLMCTLGGSMSMIKNSLLKNSEKVELDSFGRSICVLPQCFVGDVNLGKVTCYPLELPKALEKLDMVLGLNTLRKQLIYLDFEHGVAYFESR